MDIQEKQALQKLINEMHDVTGMWSVEQMVTHVWQAAKAQADTDINDLKAQLKAVHESRAKFVQYCNGLESSTQKNIRYK